MHKHFELKLNIDGNCEGTYDCIPRDIWPSNLVTLFLGNYNLVKVPSTDISAELKFKSLIETLNELACISTLN